MAVLRVLSIGALIAAPALFALPSCGGGGGGGGFAPDGGAGSAGSGGTGASGGGGGDAGPDCTSSERGGTSCASLGATCGTISDGCGGELDCGGCLSNMTCTGNVCAIAGSSKESRSGAPNPGTNAKPGPLAPRWNGTIKAMPPSRTKTMTSLT